MNISSWKVELGRACRRAVWYADNGEGAKGIGQLAGMWKEEEMHAHMKELWEQHAGKAKDWEGDNAVGWKGRGLPWRALQPTPANPENNKVLLNWKLTRDGYTSNPVCLVRNDDTLTWTLHVLGDSQAKPERVGFLLWLAEPQFTITKVFTVRTGKVIAAPPVPTDMLEVLKSCEDIHADGEAPDRIPLNDGVCAKCQFFNACMNGDKDPARPSVWDTKNMLKKAKIKQYLAGKRFADEVSSDAKDLVASHVIVDKPQLKKWMRSVFDTPGQQPVYYLDFETITLKSPRCEAYVGSNLRVPVQYSLHVDRRGYGCLDEDIEADLMQSCEDANPGKYLPDNLEHFEYLNLRPDTADHRRELIEKLLDETSEPGCIVVWNASFEASVLKDLKSVFSDHAAAIQNRIDRLVDLADPFKRKLYRHVDFYSSYSLKAVLPVLCDGMRYPTDTSIGNGSQASLFMLQVTKSMVPIKTIKDRTGPILTYCRIDTAAMVAIASKLKRAMLVGKGKKKKAKNKQKENVL